VLGVVWCLLLSPGDGTRFTTLRARSRRRFVEIGNTGVRAQAVRGTARKERPAMGLQPPPADEVVTKVSRLPVNEAAEQFVDLLKEKAVKVFSVVDQAEEARRVGMELRATILIVFGNPVAGTPVMAAAPLSALDLPLRVLIWDDAGTTKVSYYAPESIAQRHRLPVELAGNLRAIDVLTDVLVAL
jgi:uncharacterized protein (DUF302 family)